MLRGKAENDAFNQLILFAGLDPRPVAWLRAWFRYLRQTGVAYGLATVVDALRCHASQLTVDGTDLVHSGGQRQAVETTTGLRRGAT